MDAQKVFKSRFEALINEEYSIGNDIERYQGVLEHALLNADFLVRKQFKPKHWKDEGTQEKKFSEQPRHENWFKSDPCCST